jgi:hypothetical protein
VAVGILARAVDVETVVGVLDDRDLEAAGSELGKEFSSKVVLPEPE